MEQHLRPRRNAEATRARILKAAQAAFARGGYDHVGIREIATDAGVSSTLLLRYFGSKAGLLEAALIASMSLDAVLTAEKSQFGAHLAALFLRNDLDVRPPVLMGVVAGDPTACAITARVTETHLISPLTRWLGGADARARAIQISMLATGFVIYARQLDIAASAKPALYNWFAKAVQAVIDDVGAV